MGPTSTVEAIQRIYSLTACGLTVLCGAVSLWVERMLFRRAEYRREATIAAVVGWLYLIGGPLFYVTLWVLGQWT